VQGSQLKKINLLNLWKQFLMLVYVNCSQDDLNYFPQWHYFWKKVVNCEMAEYVLLIIWYTRQVQNKTCHLLINIWIFLTDTNIFWKYLPVNTNIFNLLVLNTITNTSKEVLNFFSIQAYLTPCGSTELTPRLDTGQGKNISNNSSNSWE